MKVIKTKKRGIILNIIGIFLIVLGLIGIIANIKDGSAYNIIWLCNHTSLIMGLAFVFRSPFWVTAQLNLGFFPQLIWSIDFLSKLMFDRFLFGGFTDYMFSSEYAKIFYILSWNHVFMLPIALAGLYILGMPRKDAWKGSILHGFLLVPISYIVGGANLNCMFESCVAFIPTTAFYKIWWPPFFLILIVFPTNFLLYYIYRKIRK